jgi:hypothetical protein
MQVKIILSSCLSEYEEGSVRVFHRAIQKLKAPLNKLGCDELLDVCVDGQTFAIYRHDTGEVVDRSLYLNERYQSRAKTLSGHSPFCREIEFAFIAANFGCRNNYYHWTLQAVLSIICFLPFLRSEKIPIVVPVCRQPYQVFWLKSLASAYGLSFVFLDDCQWIRIARLFVPPTLYKPFDFAPVIDYDRILGVLADIGVAKPRVVSSYPEKVYIFRGSAARRKLVNESKVEEIVGRHGFEVVSLENLNVADQINLFMNCRMIMAPHGAGLANLIFSNPCLLEEVQEIASPYYLNPCFFAIAHRLQIRNYTVLLSVPVGVSDRILGRARHRHAQESRMPIATLKQMLAGRVQRADSSITTAYLSPDLDPGPGSTIRSVEVL